MKAWLVMVCVSSSISDGDRQADQFFELGMLKAVDLVDQLQPRRRAFEGGEVGIHALHAADASQRISALVDDLALALLGEQIHHDPGLLGADGKVHRAADGRNRALLAGAPVREIAGGGDLERTQHADVEMAATHHREAVGMVEVRAARQQGDRLLAGIDQVVVFLAFGGRGAHAEDPVLAVQDDFAADGKVIGNERGLADAEIDDGAVEDVLRDALCELVLGAALVVAHGHAAFLKPPACVATRSILTILLTKMPGVTMDSGSISPSSAISCTVAMVRSAAMAITGPKLRAALRYTRLPQRSPFSALISAMSPRIGYSSTYCLPSISRVSRSPANSVPKPVGQKNAPTPAPAARMRSARLPWGTSS